MNIILHDLYYLLCSLPAHRDIKLNFTVHGIYELCVQQCTAGKAMIKGTVLYTGMSRCKQGVGKMQCLHSSQCGRKNRGRSQYYHSVHLFKTFLVFTTAGIQNFLPQTAGGLRLICLKTCFSAFLSNEELQLSIFKNCYF